MKFSPGFVATLLFVSSLVSSHISANEVLTLKVSNQSGDPVEYAVISAFRQNVKQHTVGSLNKIIVIDQIDKEFIAHVTPVQVGTVIDFPNHDQIRHHVYSFSSAKNFEIPLYKGSPANLITFEKAGIVSLGCNIHDWMSAYIYVVDTPYFTVTDKEGQASLELPSGNYEVRYWHPNIDPKSGTSKQIIKVETGSEKTISIQLDLKQIWSFRRGPLSNNKRGRYR